MKDIDIVLQETENARVLLTAFQTMLDNSPDMVFVKDRNLVYLGATMPFVRMVGKQSVEDVIGRSDLDIFADEALAKRYIADDRKMFLQQENLTDFIEPLPEVDGQPRFGTTSKYILTDRQGNQIGLLGVTRDITKDILAKQNHRRELEYLFELPADTYAAIFIDVTDWRIIGERRQTVDQLSLPAYDSIDILLEQAQRHIPDRDSARAFYHTLTRETLQSIYDSGRRTVTLEYPRSMQDNSFHWIKTDITFLNDPDTSHLCAMILIRDIDDQKQAERQILRAAETDEMTGLLNRAATMRYIDQVLADPASTGLHALLIIDVDNFKLVNDTLGHQAGDRLLIQLAQAIKGCFRSTDIVGRVGGDEFFVLMKDISSRGVVEEKASTLLRAMQAVCDTCPVPDVSSSIGICLYNGNCHSLEQLYEKADQALYQAKRAGKNRIVFAEPSKSF